MMEQKMNPTVMIMMAVYNGEKYLGEQIDSIIGQDYPNWTLYVQDDGSKDGTEELVRKYEEKDSRIHYVKNETENHGAFINFHELSNKVKDMDAYDYYMFADQDDVWKPNKISVFLEKYSHLKKDIPCLMYADMELIDGNGNVTSQSIDKEWKISGKNVFGYFLSHKVFGCNLIMNRRCFQLIPKLNTKDSKIQQYSHDNLYAKAAALMGRVVYIDKVTMGYRRHGDNVTSSQEYKTTFSRVMKKVFALETLASEHKWAYNHCLMTLALLRNNNTLTEKQERIAAELERIISKGGIYAVDRIKRYNIVWGTRVQNISHALILFLGNYKKYLYKDIDVRELEKDGELKAAGQKEKECGNMKKESGKLYYIRENQENKNVAGPKARRDAMSIIEKMGFECISIEQVMKETADDRKNKVKRLLYNNQLRADWAKCISQFKKGDVVFIQLPILGHPMMIAEYLKKARKKGVKFILLVHDLEAFRQAQSSDLSKLKRWFISDNESGILNNVDFVIAHNEKMKAKLVSELNIPEEKIGSLEIFDYLIDGDINSVKRDPKDRGVIIAGSLSRSKVGYIYKLPENIDINLYGIGYEDEGKKNVSYKGSFTPEELPLNLEGGFGLVWDGSSADTCDGIFGQYLTINNPHKTSLYLASNLPVIIWKEAALSSFIEENKCGFAVSSTEEIHDILASMSEEEYLEMVENAKKIGEKLRGGFYLEKVVAGYLKEN